MVQHKNTEKRDRMTGGIVLSLCFVSLLVTHVDCYKNIIKIIHNPASDMSYGGNTYQTPPLPTTPLPDADWVTPVNPSHQSLLSLAGKCFNRDDGKYVYTLCPFDELTQVSKTWGHFSGSMGIFKQWTDDHKLLYADGTLCASGKKREALVSFKCGPKRILQTVTEPKSCSYEVTLLCPEACVTASHLDNFFTSDSPGFFQHLDSCLKDVETSAGLQVDCLHFLQQLKVAATIDSTGISSFAHTTGRGITTTPLPHSDLVKLPPQNSENLKNDDALQAVPLRINTLTAVNAVAALAENFPSSAPTKDDQSSLSLPAKLNAITAASSEKSSSSESQNVNETEGEHSHVLKTIQLN